MRKLKLDLEALGVDSFETEAPPARGDGTVFGHMPNEPEETIERCGSANHSCECPTAVWDPLVTCADTCADTCDCQPLTSILC